MLVLSRKDGQWIEVTHTASGDVLRFRVYELRSDSGRASLAFEDAPRNFEIRRPDRPLAGTGLGRLLGPDGPRFRTTLARSADDRTAPPVEPRSTVPTSPIAEAGRAELEQSRPL